MARKIIYGETKGESEGERKPGNKGGGEAMASTLAAMAMAAFTMGAGAPASTAQASIAPEELAGTVQAYRIRSGAVAAALNELADANRLHVLFDARLTQGLRTPGLSGRYSLKEALDRLLAGTNLAYRLSRNRRSVSIVLAQNQSSPPPGARRWCLRWAIYIIAG